MARPAARVNERFADSFRKQDVTSRSQVRAQGAKRTNDADDGAEQAKHRRDHPDIGKIGHAIVQIGSDARAFRLRDFANLAENPRSDSSS